MATTIDKDKLLETYNVFIEYGGNYETAAKVLGVSSRTVRRHIEHCKTRLNLDAHKPVSSGNIRGLKVQKRSLPTKGKIKTYILTCAQNNTKVHNAFWNNLLTYAKYLDAEILVSQFTYNKTAYGKKSVKPGTAPTEEDLRPLYYDPKLAPYFCNDRIQLAPDLISCGEINILPTAVRPLSGFETYTKEASGIFPHTTFALESIATYGESPTKINYTTGAVTVKNYIQKKAGLKAEHHHAYGALVVEVCSDGVWFVRQINAEENGTFYDLDIQVEEQSIHKGMPIEGIVWGDVHVRNVDPKNVELNWGEGGILDTMQPAYQFLHDILDFHTRNHHNKNDCHKLYQRHVLKQESVEDEIKEVTSFLNNIAHRDWCNTIVVNSNHDNALERWLREADYKQDPVNALFYLETQLAKYKAIKAQDKNFFLLEHVMQKYNVNADIQFLREDENFVLCGEIECGMHGHNGPNGSKGTPLGISRIGRKTNTAHTHSAQIIHGAYVAGTSTHLQLEYNRGPSSWSVSHIFVYLNGKRAIITVKDYRYRG